MLHLLGSWNSDHSSCSHHPAVFKLKWVLLGADFHVACMK